MIRRRPPEKIHDEIMEQLGRLQYHLVLYETLV